MQTIREKVLSESRLISLPEVYLKLQELLINDEYSLSDIAEVIGLDPAITSRLLRTVNSSFFGLSANIDTVSRAINYLGTQQVHDLVLSTSIAQTFSQIHSEAFNLHQFWRHSIYCAIAGKEIARICELQDSERLFVIGLLHDIGHLMMYQSIPQLTNQAKTLASQQKLPLYQSERQHLGFDFSSMGAELLKRWNLPESMTESIKHQIDPSTAEQYQLETAILHIAARLAVSFSEQVSLEDTLQSIQQQAIQKTDINVDHLLTVSTYATENLEAVTKLLFPQL